MRRVLVVPALLVLFGVGVWLFLWRSVSRDARTARPYARELVLQVQHDARFNNIEVGVWEFGSKGPLYVRGILRSDSDATELRRRLDSLHCPVGISWQIVVDTNRLDGAR